MNALAVSDTTIIPVDLQQFGLAGMKTIFDIMDTIRKRINPGLGKPHILVCRKDIRKSIQNELHKILQERKDILMFNTYIRSNVKIEESQVAHLDIFSYSPDSTVASEYLEAAKEIINL